MASLAIFGGLTTGLDMTRFWPGTSGATITHVVTATATQFRITLDLGGGTTYDLAYAGSGFTYSGSGVGTTATGGSYTSVRLHATGSAAGLASLTGLVAQPLADIYTVSRTTLAPLASNDTLNSGSGPNSIDILLGGAGNDTIFDTSGPQRSIDGGAGNDLLRVGNAAGATGTIEGGAGIDTLVASDIGGLTLRGIERLETQNGSMLATAATFESFDTIWNFATQPTTLVRLNLLATGAATVLNLADELTNEGGPRAVDLRGTTDAETLTSAAGNDRIDGLGGHDRLSGGAGNDRLDGGEGNDTLHGGANDDWLISGAGDNLLDGGAGNDLLTNIGAALTAYGGDGDDRIVGLGTQVLIDGGAGNDLFQGTAAGGTLIGGSGIDTLAGGGDLTALTISGIEILDSLDNQGLPTTLRSYLARADQFASFQTIVARVILAATGSATLVDLAAQFASPAPGGPRPPAFGGVGPRPVIIDGSTDAETIIGGAQNDILGGGEGHDTLRGGEGDDQLSGNAGNDSLSGQAGNDTLTDTLGAGTDSLAGDAGDDLFLFTETTLGTALRGRIDGGTGNDTLRVERLDNGFGGAIPSTLDITGLTVTGVETLDVQFRVITARAAQLNAFDRVLVFANFVVQEKLDVTVAATGGATVIDLADAIRAGNATGLRLRGSADDETILASARSDSLSGGGGSNTLSYERGVLSGGVTVDLAVTTAQNTGGSGQDTISGFAHLTGSGLADSLTGTGTANRMAGGAGDDTILAGGGADVLDGGTGNDRLEGGLGDDQYVVDSLGDVVAGEAAFGAGGGIDTVTTSVDFTAPDNVEILRAAAGAAGVDLTGNDAPGTLAGNAAANVLNGRGGNDQLNGDAGNDVLTGGEGADTLVGGLGADTFVYQAVSNSRAGIANRDVLNGFDRGAVQDRIDLSAIDANTATALNDAFAFIGSAAFTAAGQVRVLGLGGPNAVIVEVNVNGDLAADMQIFVNLTTTMAVGDFVL
jgi:Ca2+-binding RTX toxin-like protein